MATNLIAKGEVFDYTVPAATTIVSGDPVLINDTFGIALIDGVTDDVIPVQVEGVFEIAKRVHATTAAISQGDWVYWDATNSVIDNTSTSGANKAIGRAYKSAASTASTVQVSLEGGGNKQAAVVAANATTAAIDLTTSEALANSLQTTVNAILTALKNAGIMKAS